MSTILELIGRLWLWAFGWTIDGDAPSVKKAVVVAAPHTSNWDVPFMLATAWALGVRVRWLGKHTLFVPPFGAFVRWLGGVPIDRRSRNDAVRATVQLMGQCEEMVLVVSPEGVRRSSDRWKTGFYYIALGAGVPVILGYLDYAKRRSGLGRLLYPTGDLVADGLVIREFYAGKRGKFQEQETDVAF